MSAGSGRLAAKHVARMVRELLLWASRSGLWWLPILVPAMAVAALAIATAAVVVPTAVYVFF